MSLHTKVNVTQSNQPWHREWLGNRVCSWYSSRCRVLGHKSRILRSVSTSACHTEFCFLFWLKMPLCCAPLSKLCNVNQHSLMSWTWSKQDINQPSLLFHPLLRFCFLFPAVTPTPPSSSFARCMFLSTVPVLLSATKHTPIYHLRFFFSWPLFCSFNFLSQLPWSVCGKQAAEKLRVSHPPVYQFNLSWNHLTTRENFTHAKTKSAVRCDRTSCSCSEALRCDRLLKKESKKVYQKRMCCVLNRKYWEESERWNE